MLKSFRRKYHRLFRYVNLVLAILAGLAIAVITVNNFYPFNKAEEGQIEKPEVKAFAEHRLVRLPAEAVAGGVLAGFAYFCAVPLWLLRVLFVCILLATKYRGHLVILYMLLFLFMPSIDFIPADFLVRTGGSAP